MTISLLGYLIGGVLITVLAWCYSVYYLVLDRGRETTGVVESTVDEEPLRFSIIIPCYQEEGWILEKLENTAMLKYPEECVDIFVVDGGSTDETPKIAEEYCVSRKNYHFVSSPKKGKIPQLNHILKDVDGGIVVVTDVDGKVAPDALQKLAQLYRDPRVGCVSAFAEPTNPSPEEKLFWRYQNAMRSIESERGHVSVMIAVFYSFRRELFHLYPEDVVADDVYVAFCGNTRGYRCHYSAGIRAAESRSASSFSQMLEHKLRKVNANMKELVRFWPRLAEMRGVWLVIYITKYAQHWFVAPSILALVALFTATLALDGVGALKFWGLAVVTLVFLQGMANKAMKKYMGAAEGKRDKARIGRKLLYMVFFHMILLLGLIRYFVVRQSSVYKKVN